MSNTIRKGKLFEPGHFADKGITITRDDLEAAAAAFTPVRVNLDHRSTVLDGHLGTLRAVQVSADGTLTGEYEEPGWLLQVLGNIERKVSLEFDRATKKITGMALTLSPRIETAALFAAFSHSGETDAEFTAPVVFAEPEDEQVNWGQVDAALAQSGYPPAQRPEKPDLPVAFAEPEDEQSEDEQVDYEQVNRALEQFKAWPVQKPPAASKPL